jgi:uncharacterized protein (TIGR02246 family)
MESIDDVIHQTEAAFNASDAEALAGTFTDDAWTVGVTGQVLHGRDEILAVSRELFAGALKGQFARYVVDEVRHLAPDVAIARKLAFATDEHGNDLDADHAMVALYVLVRGEAGWRVAARQNTLAPH